MTRVSQFVYHMTWVSRDLGITRLVCHMTCIYVLSLTILIELLLLVWVSVVREALLLQGFLFQRIFNALMDKDVLGLQATHCKHGPLDTQIS